MKDMVEYCKWVVISLLIVLAVLTMLFGVVAITRIITNWL